MLDLAVRTAIAVAVAPAMAAPAGLLIAGLLGDDPLRALLMAPLFPITWLTIPGIYGYFFAFGPVLLLGPALTLAARAAPRLRRKRVWIAAGALGGIGLALALTGPVPPLILVGAAAGAASAITYRLIVGGALVPRGEPGAAP
ncbi:MAG TPA: hypothetical protein VD887_12685 [Allosphingosinicella sp.]|nr:hypothetical protein [Allosphingosinicella sp.]